MEICGEEFSEKDVQDYLADVERMPYPKTHEDYFYVIDTDAHGNDHLEFVSMPYDKWPAKVKEAFIQYVLGYELEVFHKKDIL